jgi:hypothetical protein
VKMEAARCLCTNNPRRIIYQKTGFGISTIVRTSNLVHYKALQCCRRVLFTKIWHSMKQGSSCLCVTTYEQHFRSYVILYHDIGNDILICLL